MKGVSTGLVYRRGGWIVRRELMMIFVYICCLQLWIL